MPLPADQLSRLHRAQLTALVRSRWGDVEGDADTFPSGASLRTDGHGWVLALDAGPRALGGALVWASARGVDELHVLVDVHAGVLAREAGRFDRSVDVWTVHGAELSKAQPDAVAPPAAPSAAAEMLGRELEMAGLDVVEESGIIRAEVLGLEIARVVEDPDTGSAHLEAGVGRFDREMSALMHRDEAPLDAVSGAAATVAEHRHAGAPPHPLRDLCRERWVRHDLLANPSLVGASRLEPIGTTLERPNLRDPWPALAIGTTAGGGPIVVAATVGDDLDAVVLAADTRAHVAPDADLIVVSPRPLPPSMQAVGESLASPARFTTVDPPWE